MADPADPSVSPRGADALPAARFKASPEDFVVDEIPAYAPSGQGDHFFVKFRKRGLTTPQAVDLIAKALGADPREAGIAGMKDKVAVATQTASFMIPRGSDPDALLGAFEHAQIEVLSASRHNHKLKPGHLAGNRFKVVLRDLDDAAIAAIEPRLLDARERGVPNFYGHQRFGMNNDNAMRALGFVRGEKQPPRDKKQQRFLFSSLQSDLFNRVLERRIADETWAVVLPGDLAKKHDTGGLFLVPLEGPELDDARERAKAGAISATGPMFGASMRAPEGAVLELESAVLREAGLTPELLAVFRHAGEGTRRSLRMLSEELTWSRVPGASGGKHSLEVRFVLDKGSYATTLLGTSCRLVEPHSGRDLADPAERDSTSVQ